ncbi:MAG: NlpC/P60 family protein [Pseudomonadota bacterium]
MSECQSATIVASSAASADPGRVISIARDWLGTPYHHQASLRGIGCDCIGLIRGVWRDLHGPEPEAVPGYSGLWAEVGGQERLIEAARRHLIEADFNAGPLPGDVVLFRYRADVIAKHAAIISDDGRMIHAYEARGVVETALGPWWRRRIAARFRYPETI